MMEKNIEKIKSQIQIYKKSLSEINKKRELWHSTIKEKLFQVLTEIKEVENLNWSVQKIEFIKNLENVNLRMNDSGGGISEGASGEYIKHGGILAFCQSYNDDIFVVVTYPFVEHHVSQLEPKILDVVSPYGNF